MQVHGWASPRAQELREVAEVAVLISSPSLIVLEMVSADVKQH